MAAPSMWLMRRPTRKLSLAREPAVARAHILRFVSYPWWRTAPTCCLAARWTVTGRARSPWPKRCFPAWERACSVWLMKKNMRMAGEKLLADGSYLSHVYPSERDWRHKTNWIVLRVIDYRLEGIEGSEPIYRLATTILDPGKAPAGELAALYHERWEIGVSSQGHINQPVQVRPRLTDSSLVAWEASWSESETMKPSDNMLRKEYAQLTRLQ